MTIKRWRKIEKKKRRTAKIDSERTERKREKERAR